MGCSGSSGGEKTASHRSARKKVLRQQKKDKEAQDTATTRAESKATHDATDGEDDPPLDKMGPTGSPKSPTTVDLKTYLENGSGADGGGSRGFFKKKQLVPYEQFLTEGEVDPTKATGETTTSNNNKSSNNPNNRRSPTVFPSPSETPLSTDDAAPYRDVSSSVARPPLVRSNTAEPRSPGGGFGLPDTAESNRQSECSSTVTNPLDATSRGTRSSQSSINVDVIAPTVVGKPDGREDLSTICSSSSSDSDTGTRKNSQSSTNPGSSSLNSTVPLLTPGALHTASRFQPREITSIFEVRYRGQYSDPRKPHHRILVPTDRYEAVVFSNKKFEANARQQRLNGTTSDAGSLSSAGSLAAKDSNHGNSPTSSNNHRNTTRKPPGLQLSAGSTSKLSNDDEDHENQGSGDADTSIDNVDVLNWSSNYLEHPEKVPPNGHVEDGDRLNTPSIRLAGPNDSSNNNTANNASSAVRTADLPSVVQLRYLGLGMAWPHPKTTKDGQVVLFPLEAIQDSVPVTQSGASPSFAKVKLFRQQAAFKIEYILKRFRTLLSKHRKQLSACTSVLSYGAGHYAVMEDAAAEGYTEAARLGMMKFASVFLQIICILKDCTAAVGESSAFLLNVKRSSAVHLMDDFRAAHDRKLGKVSGRDASTVTSESSPTIPLHKHNQQESERDASQNPLGAHVSHHHRSNNTTTGRTDVAAEDVPEYKFYSDDSSTDASTDGGRYTDGEFDAEPFYEDMDEEGAEALAERSVPLCEILQRPHRLLGEGSAPGDSGTEDQTESTISGTGDGPPMSQGGTQTGPADTIPGSISGTSKRGSHARDAVEFSPVLTPVTTINSSGKNPQAAEGVGENSSAGDELTSNSHSSDVTASAYALNLYPTDFLEFLVSRFHEELLYCTIVVDELLVL